MRRQQPSGAEYRGQIVGLDAPAGGDGDRVLDRVLELAHVAGVVVALEQLHRCGTEFESRALPFRRGAVEEVRRQESDVLTPFAKRRQLDLNHVQPVVEIAAKSS